MSFPYITSPLLGIGGQIKVSPSHFVVEEIPLYEPGGVGEHVYVNCTRQQWTTRALQKRLAEIFGLAEVDVGYAGLKDKQAQARQTFSLRIADRDESTVAQLIQENLAGVEVHWSRRHRNKLRTGHLLGNRFRIVLLHPVSAPVEPPALEQAQRIAQVLHERGLPNYYGGQRFGFADSNIEEGRQILLGRGPRNRWLRRFLLSAYQSFLFNTWLTERIGRGWFACLRRGDIAKKLETGGLFEVLDPIVEEPRLTRREITYTGPIYGARMRWATAEAGELENVVLQEAGITLEMLQQVGLPGTRRPARLFLTDLAIETHPEGLLFTMTLPKGAYATTVLREFMKEEISWSEQAEPGDE